MSYETKKLSSFDKDVLITFLMDRITIEHRGLLMRELPLIYNRLNGKEIMKVTQPEEK